MRIEKSTKIIQKRVVIKPARYEEEKTGDTTQVSIELPSGKTAIEERPVVRRVYKEPVEKYVEEKIDIWCINDGDDIHEFMNKQDAKKFQGGK